jgi:hypothetical protein
MFRSIPKISRVERVLTEPIGYAVPSLTSNTWRLALGLLEILMLPQWESGGGRGLVEVGNWSGIVARRAPVLAHIVCAR